MSKKSSTCFYKYTLGNNISIILKQVERFKNFLNFKLKIKQIIFLKIYLVRLEKFLVKCLERGKLK